MKDRDFGLVAASLFALILAIASTAHSAPAAMRAGDSHMPRPIPHPVSTLYTSVALCQAELNTVPPVNLTVEAYIRSSVPGSGTSTYSDPQGLVTQVHRTTNNDYRRDGESAVVTGSVDASTGIALVTINTQHFADCRDCYALTVTNGPSGGRTLTGTLQFAGETAKHTLDCGALF